MEKMKKKAKYNILRHVMTLAPAQTRGVGRMNASTPLIWYDCLTRSQHGLAHGIKKLNGRNSVSCRRTLTHSLNGYSTNLGLRRSVVVEVSSILRV